MAATTRNDVSSTGILQEWLQRSFLKNFDPNLQFAQFASAPDSPEGYNTLRWAKFTTIAESAITTGTTSTDGVTPSDTAFSITSTTATPTQYTIVVSVSDMLLATNPMPLLTKVSERIGVVMAQKLDSIVQTSISSGTQVYYGGSAGNRAALAATDVLSYTLILKAAQKLRANSAPAFGQYYVAIIHPFCEYDFKNTNSGINFTEIHKYAQPEALYNGEMGMIAGVRLIRSAHINTFASNTTVYPTYVFGADVFGLGYWQRPQVMMAGGTPTDSDPAAQRRKVSGKMAVAAVLLQDTGLVRLETGATAL